MQLRKGADQRSSITVLWSHLKHLWPLVRHRLWLAVKAAHEFKSDAPRR